MKRFLLIISLSVVAAVVQAQQIKMPKLGKDLTSKEIVEYLASDALQGRLGGTKGDTLASDFIYAQMKKLGLNPVKQEFTVKRGNVVTFNVYGKVEGSTGKYIVIGAHYDHLGLGGKEIGSRRPDTVAVHNGADDNASGIAGVLHLAKHYAKEKNLEHGFVFVAFGAEERGIVGSKHFAENIDPKKVVAMVNFDMIGNLRNNAITLGGTGTAKEMDDIIYWAEKENWNALKITRSAQGHGPSDHTSFYAKNIPVFYITTGATEDYHTPDDDSYKIKFGGIDSVANFVKCLVNQIQKYPQGLTFTETGSPEASPMRGGFKVSLGLMPDVTGQVENGLRADMVVKGKPAHKAGMKNGDVIVQVNDIKIKDIEVYMKALGTLEKGDLVKVKVLRGAEEIVLNVQL
ncbi:MAG: M20/M25/M40 family metallo-hydrolase [Bacteroidales bacterium]|nr:M20/M25/M40 family metallo-hydrolase [Bacteroidales bacterium]